MAFNINRIAKARMQANGLITGEVTNSIGEPA